MNRVKQLLSSIRPMQIDTTPMRKRKQPKVYDYGATLAARSQNILKLAQGQEQLAKAANTNAQTLAMQINKPYGGPGNYFTKLRRVESSGKYDAVNPGSGAVGAYQFLEGTARPYLQKLGADWNTFKSNPQIQDKVAMMFTSDIDAQLRRNGLPITDVNRYALHQQGLSGGINLLKGLNVSQRNLQGNGVSNAQQWFSKFAPMFK